MKKLLLTSILVLFMGTFAYAANDSFTLHTVIPTSEMNLGADGLNFSLNDPDAVEGAVCDPGKLSINGSHLWLCPPGGVHLSPVDPWEQSGTAIYPEDGPGQNVIIGGTPSDNEFKLNLVGDGGIIAKGVFGSGATLTTAGAGARMIWYPKKAAFLVGEVTGTQFDDANVNDNTVNMGENNQVLSPNSSALGGELNELTFKHALVTHGVIGGGLRNKVHQLIGVVGGGRDNEVGEYADAGGWGSGIFSGDLNKIKGGSMVSVIAGGSSNSIDGDTSFIGGGGSNEIIAQKIINGYSTIPGGLSNTIKTSVDGIVNYSTIGGGQANTVQANNSVIAGGSSNSINFDGTNVTEYNTIGGGLSNSIGTTDNPGGWSTIGGGKSNVITVGSYITIGGGDSNAASGDYATVPGGQANIAAGDYSFAAGRNMQLSATADRTFVWGHSATPVAVTDSDKFIIRTGNLDVSAGDATVSGTVSANVANISTVLHLVPSGEPVAPADGDIFYDAGTSTFCGHAGGLWYPLAPSAIDGGSCP